MQEKTFANSVDRLPFVKIFPVHILLYYIALCLYIEGKVTHANVLAKIPILRISQKFSTAKMYRFMVCPYRGRARIEEGSHLEASVQKLGLNQPAGPPGSLKQKELAFAVLKKQTFTQK